MTLSIYSGRQNPSWKIIDKEEVNSIKEKLSQIPKIQKNHDFEKYLGGFIIFNHGLTDFPNTVIINSGILAVGFGKERQYFNDTNYELENYMTGLARKSINQDELPEYYKEGMI
mgnify:FL=1